MLNISEKANESTINGSKIVHNIVLQMNVISKIVGDLSTLIQNLDEKSKEIGNITSMITNISEQTNLLALNAAIEAAREMASVGDHIVTSSEHVKDIAEASVLASQESSAATEEQLATMEEISSSAHALTSLAEELQNTIARFKV